MSTADQVFTPTTGATVGNTVKVTANNTPTSVAGTIAKTATGNTIRVFNNGTIPIYVRISIEATPTATNADVLMAAGAVETFASPGGSGAAVGLAVLSTTVTSGDVYFTPGYGT